jgi:hypothetical protein
MALCFAGVACIEKPHNAVRHGLRFSSMRGAEARSRADDVEGSMLGPVA